MSIIIPALNEEEGLTATLAAASESAAEILVVDAGSSDATVEIADSFGATVIRSQRKQRAFQLNRGAEAARGETLLFLHADTLLPPKALAAITEALSHREIVGGAFVRHYASPSSFLRVTCALASWRNRLLGWHLGDQAMFVRRALFHQLGGFAEVGQFEDLDFSRRLSQLGRVVTLSPGVVSSSRRFQQGAIVRTARDFGLTIRYLLRGLPSSSR